METGLQGLSLHNLNSYLIWNTVTEAVHEIMDSHKCDTTVHADHCE